jgi:hypothetical protein
MGYKNKKVTKTRQEPRTRVIPGVGVETYYEMVSYEEIQSVWEPDTTPSPSVDTYSYGGE